ncbi:MAG: MetS family NSS transporter small subunit [Microbacteriaceae bacterium]|nr:MetS family NSS transporter small subunit [Microbacteriaceae bacterium]
MDTQSLLFMLFAGLIIWGGWLASLVFYLRKPEVDFYPEGGNEEDTLHPPQEWVR